tara:strand:- start:69 stop:1034 length:966 start_codon:yes stop_codon:yes gene_type:complete
MKATDFLDKFERINSTEKFEKKYTRNIVKTCKFCSKSTKETTFDNVPHIIPELLGKNNFTSNEECDNCNELFGRFETDLANYISPYQTIIGQKTKKKIPIFQSRKDENQRSTMIKNVNGKPHFNFGNNLSDFNYDYQNKQLNVTLKKKKFVPINVYKGLVKIGLSLCPNEELESYKKTINWLSQKEDNIENIIYDIPLLLLRTRFSNKYYSKPSAVLFKRKASISENIYRPNLCLIVYSGILVFQIFIPFCKETQNINPKEYKFEYDLFPAFILDVDFPKNQKKIELDLINLSIAKYDMNYYGQVKENELIGFKYDNIIRN